MTLLSKKPPNYYSYILRCWVEANLNESGVTLCRYSLEDPRTGERLTFPGLEPLIEFLQARAKECGAAAGDDGR